MEPAAGLRTLSRRGVRGRETVAKRFRAAPDLAAVARACHASGVTVEKRTDLQPALARALKIVEGRSAVVDVRIAPN